MSKIELDANILASIAQTLANAAMALNQAITPAQPEPKKRGRPTKNKEPKKFVDERTGQQRDIEVTNIVENIQVDNVDEILSEDNQKNRTPAQKANYIFNLKGRGNRSVASRKEAVTDNKKQQKFIDVDSVKHEIPQWEPTERSRAPAEMIEFHCSKCSRTFRDYPSNHPEAFFGAGGTGDDYSESYSIMCNRCGVK